jgi:tetratricopeptide (TPR) repeat protein
MAFEAKGAIDNQRSEQLFVSAAEHHPMAKISATLRAVGALGVSSVHEYSALKYRVVLSYSQRDRLWGKWLAGELASHRIDKDLVGRQTAVGPVPKTLRPIFCSCEDAVHGDAPNDAHLTALQTAQFLIVLCSPAAAASPHVNEDISRFNAMHRAGRVIPVIVDGEPGDRLRDCFPSELRYRLDRDRRATDELGRPILDARPDRDGQDFARRRVLARVLGLDFGEVEDRDERARWRRGCFRAGIAACLIALPLIGYGGMAWMRHQLADNEALLERTLASTTVLTGKAVAASRQLGVPRRLSVGALLQAESALRDLADLVRETPQMRFRKASMLIDFARNYGALGHGELQRARATEADGMMQRLAAEASSNFAWLRQLSVTFDELGDLFHAQGRLKEALASFRASATIAERLAVDPGITGRQRDLAALYIKLGNVDVAQGALDEALASYLSSLAIEQRRAAVDRGEVRWQVGLLQSHQKIADVLRAQGETEAALTSYQVAGAIAEALVARMPGHAEWQRELAVAQVKIGDAFALLEKPEAALASYRVSHAIAERFAADTGDARWQKELGISHERIGSVLEAQGDLVQALKEYRASLAIARPLAAAAPGNAAWQRDLGIAHEHIGDVLRTLGDFAGALGAYDAKRAIITRLTATDAANAGWQYELGISHTRIGLLQEARGDFAAALAEYEAGLAIGRRFAAEDPGNPGWRRDVAVSYGQLATAHHRLGQVRQALVDLRRGREIMAALVEIAPNFTPWNDDLARFDRRIAALEGRDVPLARTVAAAACEPPCSEESPAASTAAVVLASDARQRIGALPPIKTKVDN